MKTCKVCGALTSEVMSFGKMPIANGFIADVDDNEFFYDLNVYFCPACYMVQLGETVRPEQTIPV